MPEKLPFKTSTLAILLLAYCLAARAQTTQTSTSGAATTTTKKSSLIPPPRRDVPGERHSASLGNLYVPDFFEPDPSGTDVVVFFHGASWCAEQNFYDARKNAVLISVSMTDYERVFSDPDMLRQVLKAAKQKLSDEEITKAPLRKLVLTSFSGGYSAVGAILRHEDFATSIAAVALADSLYPKKIDGKIDPDSIAPFLKYAERAANSDGVFLFSQLFPPEVQHRGNTTTLAADYLIEKIGAKRVEDHTKNSRGEPLLYRADKGGFHVLGYEGMTTQDHFEHFYAICDLWRLLPLEDAVRP